MEQRSKYITPSSIFFFFIFCCFIVLCHIGSVEGYKNYTVGGSLGWYDKLMKPSVDYRTWVSHKNFSLGDFLIFNTDNNHSVVQTYNLTTYKLCDSDNAQENDTTQWSASDPSATAPESVSISVPLVKEGKNYFFSGYYDGEQCKNGQHFKINVTHGQGLPPSLKTPLEDAPAPENPDANDPESAPDTIVPANFNDPRDDEAADSEASRSSGSLMLCLKGLDVRFVHGILLFVGFVCMG